MKKFQSADRVVLHTEQRLGHTLGVGCAYAPAFCSLQLQLITCTMPGNKISSIFKKVFPAIKGIERRIFIFLSVVFVLSVGGLIILASRFDVGDKSFGRTISDTLLTIFQAPLSAR